MLLVRIYGFLVPVDNHLEAAIVTDERGITSHAAIVARELGVPCVVGARNATKVLRDGDRAAVDAAAGKVWKIRQ